MTTPPADWATGTRPGTDPVGYVPATNEVAGINPIYVGGDADPGGRDIVASSVAGAVANTEARYGELQADTRGLGSQIGDSLTLPPVPAYTMPPPPLAGYPNQGDEPIDAA